MSMWLDTAVSLAGRALAIALIACSTQTGAALTAREKDAIRGEIEAAMREAYDLSKPNVVERMLSLYPKVGRVISANSGRATESRDSIASGIRAFWDNVGVNMREPRWVWDRFYVDVLSPTAAVVTAMYRIPHKNPRNQPHVLGGAMTAVFEKRDGRWVIVQEHLSDLPQQPDSLTNSMRTHDHH